ncbi:MAG: aldo/keto reductase [Actinomycetales bacterium]|nr:aldo/keto reductase [Actinomycetales bacterium]
MSALDMVQSATCRMPAMGLGTYGLRGIEGASVIESALDEGYRLIDTAVSYENEGAVGAAVRAADEPREDIFVTSKLPGRHHAKDQVGTCIEESLMRMGLDHLDLYLIHWPLPNQDRYVEAWQGLIDARDKGLVTHIGVSNFNADHIERLWKETSVLPEVNQIEIHPYFPQHEIVEFHRERDIITQAWSPLGRGSGLLIEPALLEIAIKYQITPAQVVLRWLVERGIVPLPKSASVERLAENLDVLDFELDEEDTVAIAALEQNGGRLWGGDPLTHEEM